MKQLEHINEKYLKIIEKFKKQKRLREIKFVYEGFHNKTFKCIFDNEICQLRIPTGNLVDHEKENTIIAKMPDTLYYENGLLIRKWFEAKTAEEVSLDLKKQKAIIKELKKFQKQNLDVRDFNWDYYGTEDKKYHQLIKKYSRQPKVLMHGDLAPKNILINEDNVVKLIDLEWVTKGLKAFDIIALYRMDFDKKLIQKEFNISDQEFDDYLYICQKFGESAYTTNYVQKLRDTSKMKKIDGGWTNSSFKYNDKFIQFKNKSPFTHRLSLKKLNKFPFALTCNYEDEDMYVRNYATVIDFDINNSKNVAKIANSLNELHNIDWKTPKNNIYKRAVYWYKKLKNIPQITQNFSKTQIEKILTEMKNLDSEVMSHNDFCPANIIMTKDKVIKFIDFENTCRNSKYWDIAYLSSNPQVTTKTEKKLFNLTIQNGTWNEYFKIKCLVNFYALLWSAAIDDGFDLRININNVKKYLKFL